MNEFSDSPPSQPQIDFQQVIDALLEADTPFPARFLYRFSDLQVNDLERLKEIWPDLKPERRERLLEDLELLAEGNFTVSFDAVYMLGLSDPSARVRQLAIRALWEAEDKALVPVLINILEKDTNLDTRAQAANGLGKFIYLGEFEEIPESLHRDTLETLLKATGAGYPELVRRRALEGLGFSSDPRVTGLIEKAYNKDNDEWLISALIAMGRSAHSQWIPMVIENINHSDNLVRLRAVQAAGELSAAKAVEHLLESLQDPDDDIRLAAVWALSEIGGPEARDAIEIMLEETDDEEEIDMIEDALENLEFSDMVNDFTLLDLDEAELEDMIHPKDEEDPDA
jgi:HEAT repeat protein